MIYVCVCKIHMSLPRNETKRHSAFTAAFTATTPPGTRGLGAVAALVAPSQAVRAAA